VFPELSYQHFPFKHFDITQMKIVHEQVVQCTPISIYYRLFYELQTLAKCIQISLIHISVPPSFSLRCLYKYKEQMDICLHFCLI